MARKFLQAVCFLPWRANTAELSGLLLMNQLFEGSIHGLLQDLLNMCCMPDTGLLTGFRVVSKADKALTLMGLRV